ncbi:VWA domain-containing protein [candidate division WOR-3 bacterium]|nr:VWA domain-containing protein [candidate division WOR-3 bacterium]
MGIHKPTVKRKIKNILRNAAAFLRFKRKKSVKFVSRDNSFKKLGGKEKSLKTDYSYETPLFESEKSFFKTVDIKFKRFLKRIRKTQNFRTRKFTRRAMVKNTVTGRNFLLTKYKEGENSPAFYPTLLNRLLVNEFREGKKAITKKDLLGWQKSSHQSLNMILVVDVSSSVINFVKAFSRIINSLTVYFNKNKDRIGVISLQGHQAKILNHPTHNYKVVSKSLLSLKVHGRTPLSDGLLKSLDMARLEKFRNKGSLSLVVLLSDCYPEPLTGKFRNIFDEPAYRNSLSAAKLFRKAKIGLLLINPNFKHTETQKEKYFPGEKLSEFIVENAGGKLVKLMSSAISSKTVYTEKDRYEVSPKDIERIISGVASAAGSSKSGL